MNRSFDLLIRPAAAFSAERSILKTRFTARRHVPEERL